MSDIRSLYKGEFLELKRDRHWGETGLCGTDSMSVPPVSRPAMEGQVGGGSWGGCLAMDGRP